MGSRTSSSRPPAVLLLLTLQVLLFISQAPRSSSASFICNSTASSSPCQALIDYVSPNTTTLSSIMSLFSINNSLALLGANDLLSSTSSNLTIDEKQTIRIPFPCTCTSNGTGISNGIPIYTVQPGDILYHIAAEVFSGVVTYQEIAAVNNLANASSITVGQKLLIPLPCSCDEVGGVRVVHYGHVVEAGSTLGGIAEKYGTTEDTLKSLNGIVNASSLQAGQVLDVPLRACNSSVSTNSVDYPLLVANGTYVFTANNCLRCKCDSANNWTLECEPSGLKPSSNWSTCPAIQQCGSLYLGNTTTGSCSKSTCSYAGFYSNETISTTLVTESTCTPAATSPSSGAGGNYATTMRSSSLNFLLTLHLLLLCLYPLL